MYTTHKKCEETIYICIILYIYASYIYIVFLTRDARDLKGNVRAPLGRSDVHVDRRLGAVTNGASIVVGGGVDGEVGASPSSLRAAVTAA